MTSVATQSLTGVQKSAILCLALGPDDAAVILKALSPEEVEAVAGEMARLESVDADVVQQVVNEYRAAAGAERRTIQGGLEAVKEILDGVLDRSQAREIVQRIEKRVMGETLVHFRDMEPRTFAGILADEHPQTIAVALSHLEVKRVSDVLAEFPPDLASEVLYRMARMEKITPDMLTFIDEGLRKKMDLSPSQEFSSPSDPSKVAKLLNLVPGEEGDALLQQIEQRDADLAGRIRALMFVFEDLLLIDKKGIQQVLRNVDGKDLALALKGASPELKEYVKKNMSERAAAALEEEIELMGAVRVRDVEEAQQRIMEGVRELEESGDVVVRREGGGDEFIS